VRAIIAQDACLAILKEPQYGGFFLASPSQESWAREAATKQFCPRTQIPSRRPREFSEAAFGVGSGTFR